MALANPYTAELLALIQENGWTLEQQSGDGNCLYRCLARQYYGDANRHPDVRREICEYLRINWAFFEIQLQGETIRVGGEVDGVNRIDALMRINKKSRDGEWGSGTDLAAVMYFAIISSISSSQ